MKKIAGFFLTLYFISVFVNTHTLAFPFRQYNLLAKSFLEGSLGFIENQGKVYDSSIYKGSFYWPLGPFPAFLLIPSLIILGNETNHQAIWTFWITLGIFFVLKKVINYFNIEKKDENWLILLYLAGTPFFGVSHMPFSWYFAHIVANFLIFSALYFFLVKKNYFLTGLLIGLSSLTRITTLFYIVFFVAYFLKNKKLSKIKTSLFMILVPFLICLLIFAIYNKARFDSFLEFGYKYQDTGFGIPKERIELGVFNLKYCFTNLKHFLFYRGSNKFGLGIVFSIPIFFLVYRAYSEKKFFVPAMSASILIFLSQLFSFSRGGMQFGNRLSLDFLPLIFLLLVIAFKKRLPVFVKIIIIYQCFINILLIYPEVLKFY